MLENYRYASLHNHSEYSNATMIDALNRINEMVDYSIELGMAGMALTDHESLSGSVKFLQYYNSLSEEKRAAFKPIIGDEIYLVDEVRQKKMYHFLLLAKNAKGFELLKRISSQAWSNSYKMGKFTRRPIKKEELVEIIGSDKGNLVATTACLGGEFPTLVNELLVLERNADNNAIEIIETKRKIVAFIKWCIDVFGKENFFIEVQPSNQADQIAFNGKAKEMAKVFGLEIVVTTDSHYLKESDRLIHTAFLTSKDETRDSAQFYRSAYFMTGQEIYNYRSIKRNFTEEELMVFLDNTVKISDMCEVYNLDKPQEVPHVDRTEELKDLQNKHGELKLDWSLYKSLEKIYLSDDKTNLYWLYRIYDFLGARDLLNHEYISRIDIEAEELHAISERLNTNLFSYYVTMTKIQDIAWDDAEAIVGLGRGSVTGFLSAWALEIQGVDSIKYDLPHWRHISKERPELPRPRNQNWAV